MEEIFGGTQLVLAPLGYEPGQNRSTPSLSAPVFSSSHRRHRHRLPFSSAAPAALCSSSAASTELFVSATDPCNFFNQAERLREFKKGEVIVTLFIQLLILPAHRGVD
ncbi:hypothetical protein XENORESO_001378 [Xenotaenia resolanae]|uniref:Uncharacterized protein n=1 Tax=Xenotaenia resolanae TaxID=208358 RepID=A0ABV0WNL5_9TELE